MERKALKPDMDKSEEAESSAVESPKPEGDPQSASFPDEPFACPNCGQMLAPSVRVCASCKQPIDPTQIKRPRVTVPVAEQVIVLPQKEQVRFSWGILGAVLAGWFLLALTSQRLLGYEKGQFVLGGVVALTSAWILYDARKKGIPKPFRWFAGSLLLWILFFPWYLSRRRTPKADYPLIEGESNRVVRTLLLILFFFLVLGVVAMLIKGPAHH